jgi:hypothetical protein
MFSSPFVIFGLAEARPKVFKRLCFGGAQAQPSALTADLTDMLISIGRRRVGAKRKGNKASID